MRAVGLSGFAQSGKTTAARYIEERYGFKRKHIAEPLRAMLAALMRANGISDEMITRYLEGDLKDGVIIPELGVTSRHLQITLGTEWGREQIGESIWSDTWMRSSNGERVMNDSVRFPNEQEAISRMGGITILIKRTGTGPAKFKGGKVGQKVGQSLYRTFGVLWGAHDSERVDRIQADFVIENDGDINDLYRKIDEVFRRPPVIPEPVKKAWHIPVFGIGDLAPVGAAA